MYVSAVTLLSCRARGHPTRFLRRAASSRRVGTVPPPPSSLSSLRCLRLSAANSPHKHRTRSGLCIFWLRVALTQHNHAADCTCVPAKRIDDTLRARIGFTAAHEQAPTRRAGAEPLRRCHVRRQTGSTVPAPAHPLPSLRAPAESDGTHAADNDPAGAGAACVRVMDYIYIYWWSATRRAWTPWVITDRRRQR